MQQPDFLSTLGKYWDEPELRDLLAALAIPSSPALRKGTPRGFLQSHAQGVELTFKQEDALDAPLREYPEGALVLANIRFYGKKTGQFQPFPGQLPVGLSFGASRDSLIKHLGPPSYENPGLRLLRWDRDDHVVFAGLSEDGSLGTLDLQLPLVKS